MAADKLGFSSSWSMLTRDKGWLKPVCILALVGWVPIIGQIVVLGYAFEWARLTAWGVNAAPKQQGVDVGKILSTGACAFGISVLMNIVLAVFNVFFPIFGMTFAMLPLGVFGLLGGSWGFGSVAVTGAGALLAGIILAGVNLLAQTFIFACCLRATLYERFEAGWRLDRVFQMVARDLGGFLHAYAVSLLAGLIPLVFVLLALAVAVPAVVAGGLYVADVYHSVGNVGWMVSVGMAPVMIGTLVVILFVFAVAVLTVVAMLVSINAVGQWFCRFEVRRWQGSSAPLPNDVPRKG